MHDENGHTHPHEHERHSHTHSHEHEHHSHTHTHTHTHSHGHTHEHPDSETTVSDENTGPYTSTLLSYLVEHNTQHTNELYELAHSAEHAGFLDVAKLINEGAAYYARGNRLLVEAYALIEKGD
ncbi:MAG: hypothetical protein LBK67_01550 [Coriobacteriales bacterium]|jgi:hypothetical protein|nr:hypothetical protein [Coriobacteriales bacterium]